MEILGFISVPGWLMTLCTICICLYLYSTYKLSIFKRYGIPEGSKPTLFLGTLPELIKKGFFQMDVDSVTQHGTYFGTFVGHIATVMVSDPDMIKEIAVKQFQNFQDRTQSVVIPWFWQKAVNNATGGHWRMLRQTISPTFSSGKLRKMEPILDKCLDSFVNVLHKAVEEEKAVVDIQSVFEALTLDIVSSTSFGIEVNSQEKPDDPFVINAREAFNINLASSPVYLINFLFPESKNLLKHIPVPDSKGLTYMKEVIKKVIHERSRSGTQEVHDLLQLLIDANQDDSDNKDDDIDSVQYEGEKKRRLTDEEVLANAVTFLIAGYDTTASTLTWVVYMLATNLEVQERLICEIDQELGDKRPNYENVFKLQYLDMVLSETLRLYAPAIRVNRQVVRDTEICGRILPGGISVTFPIAGLHRLPEFWPEPEKFDPERFSPENKEKIHRFAYMPFGLGPRNCVGMRLAQFVVKIAVVTLLQRYKIEPSDKLPVPPKIGKSITVKPETGTVLVRLVKKEEPN